MESIISLVNKMIQPLQRRIMLMVSRVVIKSVNDALKIQGVQITGLDGEVKDGMERYQNYGFTSVPKSGAEGIAVFIGGNRDHGIVIAVDDRRYRLKSLQNGEVAMYTDEGDKIIIKRGGIIIVDGKTIELGTATLEKMLKGESFQRIFNQHTHTGGFTVPTSPPTIPSTALELSNKVKAE